MNHFLAFLQAAVTAYQAILNHHANEQTQKALEYQGIAEIANTFTITLDEFWNAGCRRDADRMAELRPKLVTFALLLDAPGGLQVHVQHISREFEQKSPDEVRKIDSEGYRSYQEAIYRANDIKLNCMW